MLHLPPTNLPCPSRLKNTPKNKDHTHTKTFSQENSLQNCFRENRHETGPKAEKGEDISNMTRQNNQIYKDRIK